MEDEVAAVYVLDVEDGEAKTSKIVEAWLPRVMSM